MNSIYANLGKLQERIDVKQVQMQQLQEQLNHLYQEKQGLYNQLQHAQAEEAKKQQEAIAGQVASEVNPNPADASE